MLTGRDNRLFTPLAWTKTYALAASLIVAVIVVPMLCQVLLKSPRPRILTRWCVTIGCSALAAILIGYVWGPTLVAHTGLPRIALVVGSSLLGGMAGWWMSAERVRPVEANPVSRMVRWIYGGRLRFALNHKVLAMSFPACVFVLGLGAWMGLPIVLRPLENVARTVGANLNEVPGYVSAKHLCSPGSSPTTGLLWTKAAGFTCQVFIRPQASIRRWRYCRLRMR